MTPTQAAKKTKGKVYVVRLDKNSYQIHGAKNTTRLCSTKSLYTAADYQTALTLARLWRLELTMELMNCTPENIQQTKLKYEKMNFADIPQFTEMLREVQP